MQKYWIHQFNILLHRLCFVSLLPVAFYSWPQVFRIEPALLYPIPPCIIPLIAWYFVDSAYELKPSTYSTNSQLDASQETDLNPIESTNTIIFKPFLCKFCDMLGIIVVWKHEIPTMSLRSCRFQKVLL